MKFHLNKHFILSCLIFISLLFIINGETIEKNEYKLEIIESSGRFKFFKTNTEEKYISLFSTSDPRTSSFSIFENNGFYTLGDTFRYKRNFTATSDGGVFVWTSKELIIKQEFILDSDGFLEINILISNISTLPKTVGMKFVLDTGFENEDYFYLKTDSDFIEIENEYELESPGKDNFWTSGARNTNGAALMSIPASSKPSRVIFGNWDLLDDADYYFRTARSRVFNNPPYSINDNAVLYLYSPTDILPQNSLKYQMVFKAINSVERLNELSFEKKAVVEEKHVIVPIEEKQKTVIEKSAPLAVPEKEVEITPDVEKPSEPELQQELSTESDVKEDEVPVPDIQDVPTRDIVVEEPLSPEDEPEIPENIALKEEIESPIIRQLSTVQDIKDIIETISKPGIISDENLSALEDLIKILEAININEN